MNNHDNPTAEPSEPPEDAYVQSEISLLSPASPKPIHFPQPTNIPVLENMMDVGWNQTETHMNDPAMHNTEFRPDAWRDPNEESNEQANGNDSPFSTGGEATQNDNTNAAANSNQTASNGLNDENDAAASSASLSNGNSFEANSHLQADVPPPTADTLPIHSSNPTISTVDAETAPTADATSSQPNEVESQSTPVPTNAAPDDGMTATTSSPSQSQSQPPVAVASTDDSSAPSVPTIGAAPAGLPPRPPPQEQPLINQHYVHAQNLRDYHPHAAQPAVQSHARTNSSGNTNANLFSPTQSQPIPGNAFHSQSSPTAHPSHQHSPSANTPIESRREYKLAVGETPTVDDGQWTAEIQRKYDHFLEEERRYVNEAKWDQFPPGSRLFVGNLSSEKVTKRDIFHVFHNYGELAQVSIKQAYGFVQFLRPEDCARALVGEQGRQISDKRIHLEVSKPQKSARNQQNTRRSRSPDQRGKVDRYQSNGRGGGYPNNNRGRDSRDGYRHSYRSPSPRGGYRDRRDERYRTRSRSPPGYNSRDRYSHASPPRRDADDDLPLPRRRPQDVPEVQLISLDPLEKDFLSWVEHAFSSRGVRVDTLMISPRFPEDAVVRRQILEGVLAVSKLRRANQDMSKIGLTIFKRRGGGGEVQFEEYDHLDPHVAVELVLREKAAAGPPPPAQAYSGYRGQYQQSPPPQQHQQHHDYQSMPYPPAQQPPHGAYPPPQAGYGPQPGFPGAPPPNAAPGYSGAPQLPPGVNPNDLQNLLATLNPAAAAAGAHQTGIYGVGQQGQQSGYAPGQQQAGYGAPPPADVMKDVLARLQGYGKR